MYLVNQFYYIFLGSGEHYRTLLEITENLLGDMHWLQIRHYNENVNVEFNAHGAFLK
jgi:hypothetical protein